MAHQDSEYRELLRGLSFLSEEVGKIKADIDELKAGSAQPPGHSPFRPRKLTDEDRAIAKRVMALYGKPGCETWDQIGRRLRISRGSAWSLAHGLRKPDERTLHYLECVEWGIKYLASAVENLRRLGGMDG